MKWFVVVQMLLMTVPAGAQLHTLRELHVFETAAPVRDMKFAPDGRTFATAEGWEGHLNPENDSLGVVRLWETFVDPRQSVVRRGPVYGHSALSLDYSPRGRYLAVGTSSGTVSLINTGGRVVSTWTGLQDRLNISAVYALAYSPDGMTVAQ